MQLVFAPFSAAHASAVGQAKGAWEHFQMDYCEVRDYEGNKHNVFTLVDVYTRYMWAHSHEKQDVYKVIGESTCFDIPCGLQFHVPYFYNRILIWHFFAYPLLAPVLMTVICRFTKNYF